MQRDSICAYCSRMKRGILYSTARREGYNVLALGQHLDDLAESFVSRAFPSWNRSILAEIDLCHACSCHEISRTETPRQVMSAFNNGKLRTMKAHYQIEAGDLRVIRPLAYVREHMTRLYAQLTTMPVIADNCPGCFSQPTERAHLKQLLAQVS
jgi:tRNA 2-thiocytidine biosynthesis protein TtcA